MSILTDTKINKRKRGRPLMIRSLYDSPRVNFTCFVSSLTRVDTNNPTARLNATSISDNNGGRIELHQGFSHKK